MKPEPNLSTPGGSLLDYVCAFDDAKLVFVPQCALHTRQNFVFPWGPGIRLRVEIYVLGPNPPPGSLHPEFEKAIRGMPPGDKIRVQPAEETVGCWTFNALYYRTEGVWRVAVGDNQDVKRFGELLGGMDPSRN